MTLSAPCRFASVVLALAVLLAPFAAAQLRSVKTVLMMEDQTSAPAIEKLARAFEAELTAKSPDTVEYFRESLDTFLMPEGASQADIRRWYEHKYSKRHLDLIVTVGPASHEYMMKAQAQYFPDVPVVFLLDVKRDHDASAPDPNFTGVWSDVDPVSTIDVALQLLPATKRVVVVAGEGITDHLLIQSVKSKLQGYQGVDIIYLTGLDVMSLLGRVRSLSQDTIVLYLAVTRDSSERHMFVTYTLPLVSAAANVPVFGLIDAQVGLGIVGGQVTDMLATHLIASEFALRILQGHKPAEFPAVTSANRYVFDWKQLQRWGIDPSRLPPGAVVLNREPNVWQRYKQVILATLTLFLLLAGLVVYLLIERRRRLLVQRELQRDNAERRKAEAALVDLSSRLINAQEEERSRIARELHDDFNQRLAVLAINLKRTARIVPAEPGKAVERINQLGDQTSNIGADLHKMSRNLHSSTLDVLGLVEGVHALCDEFAEQQGLQVEFLADGVPRTLSPLTSLCLFRIVQEALSNVKKHSGSSEAVVQLHGSDEDIVVSIVDAGVGFDPLKPSFKSGLGLTSMRERLRAVGGTIEIDSTSGRGTQILVRAPLS